MNGREHTHLMQTVHKLTLQRSSNWHALSTPIILKFKVAACSFSSFHIAPSVFSAGRQIV